MEGAWWNVPDKNQQVMTDDQFSGVEPPAHVPCRAYTFLYERGQWTVSLSDTKEHQHAFPDKRHQITTGTSPQKT